MAQGNNITLEGHLTRDPELSFTPGGAAIAKFGLAVNRSVKNRQTDQWEERVSFFNVVTWNRLAENVSESLEKGNRVLLHGRLEQRAWETDEGEKRSAVEVVADDVGGSLSWATVNITKNPPQQGRGDQPPADSYDEPGGQPAGRQGGGGRAPARQTEAPAYDYDEEPF